MLGSFFSALRQLSALPLGDRPRAAEGREGEVVAFFPAAGLVLGVIPAVVLVLTDRVLNLSAPLPQALAVAALAIATGAMHLADLGRTMEALASGRPALGALEVMRARGTGARGTVAVVLVLLAKFSAVVALSAELAGSVVGLLLGILLATTLARWAAVVFATYSDYARPEGGPDEPFISYTGGRELRWALAMVIAAVVTLGLLGIGTIGLLRAILALAGCSIFAWLAAVYSGRRFGGATGECMGTVIELAEVLALVMMCALPAVHREPPRPPRSRAVAPAGGQKKSAPRKPAPKKSPVPEDSGD